MQQIMTLFFISQRIHSTVEGVSGGFFLRYRTQVRHQSITEEGVVFQGQIIHLRASRFSPHFAANCLQDLK